MEEFTEAVFAQLQISSQDMVLFFQFSYLVAQMFQLIPHVFCLPKKVPRNTGFPMMFPARRVLCDDPPHFCRKWRILKSKIAAVVIVKRIDMMSIIRSRPLNPQRYW